MKASKLIQELAKHIAEYGDEDVKISINLATNGEYVEAKAKILGVNEGEIYCEGSTW